MKNVSRAPKSVVAVAAVGIASAVTGSLLLAAPAFAATGIVGSATVVLDFSTAGEVDVEVTTQNLSGVPAYGAAYVKAPDGERYSWGPRLYGPNEVWVYTKVLTGYTCDDLTSVAAAAFGFEDLSDEIPEWTSGVVRYPDSRVTVIGCDVPPSPEPSPSSDSPSPEPSASTSAVPAAGSGNVLPPSKTDGALLASASDTTASMGATFLLAAATFFAIAAGLFVRGRRVRPTQPE